MFSQEEAQALLLSIKLALSTTLLLLIFTTPLAWWLAHSNSRFRFIVNTICSLPLVLPPTVLGFYFLLAFSPQSALGQLLSDFGLEPLVFSFKGLVVASMIYSLPFVLQPVRNAFEAIPIRTFESAYSLGASPIDTFFNIAVPLAKPGFISAAVLGFAHTLGEFGLVLMIGGNIPNETRTASIQIYNYVEALQYQNAHQLSFALLFIAVVVILALSWYQQKQNLSFTFLGTKHD